MLSLICPVHVASAAAAPTPRRRVAIPAISTVLIVISLK
jgi:hypothetical protein